jgi:hypothetical protein
MRCRNALATVTQTMLCASRVLAACRASCADDRREGALLIGGRAVDAKSVAGILAEEIRKRLEQAKVDIDVFRMAFLGRSGSPTSNNSATPFAILGTILWSTSFE